MVPLDEALLTGRQVQSLCLYTSSQALLQRLQLLCPEQNIPRSLPLAAQALVPSTGTPYNSFNWPQWPDIPATILIHVPASA